MGSRPRNIIHYNRCYICCNVCCLWPTLSKNKCFVVYVNGGTNTIYQGLMPHVFITGRRRLPIRTTITVTIIVRLGYSSGPMAPIVNIFHMFFFLSHEHYSCKFANRYLEQNLGKIPQGSDSKFLLNRPLLPPLWATCLQNFMSISKKLWPVASGKNSRTYTKTDIQQIQGRRCSAQTRNHSALIHAPWIGLRTKYATWNSFAPSQNLHSRDCELQIFQEWHLRIRACGWDWAVLQFPKTITDSRYIQKWSR